MIDGFVQNSQEESYSEPDTEWGGMFELVLSLLMSLLAVAAIVWFIIASIPIVNYHTHSSQCYSGESVVCGKDEGELFLTENPIPNPIELLKMLGNR